MKQLLIRCDASQLDGVCYGAYSVGDGDPVSVELSGDKHGTSSEIEMLCWLIDHFRIYKLIIHHDVCQMKHILKRQSNTLSRYLVKLLKDNRTTLVYVGLDDGLCSSWRHGTRCTNVTEYSVSNVTAHH